MARFRHDPQGTSTYVELAGVVVGRREVASFTAEALQVPGDKQREGLWREKGEERAESEAVTVAARPWDRRQAPESGRVQWPPGVDSSGDIHQRRHEHGTPDRAEHGTQAWSTGPAVASATRPRPRLLVRACACACPAPALGFCHRGPVKPR